MATKYWIPDASRSLLESLVPVPHEVNALDWKARLSENSSRLAEHLIAFANHPGGGTLVFGVDDGGRLIDLSAPTKVKAPMYG
jgi:predicted HTH transcriptional regulator